MLVHTKTNAGPDDQHLDHSGRHQDEHNLKTIDDYIDGTERRGKWSENRHTVGWELF